MYKFILFFFISSWCFSQQIDIVDFKTVDVELTLNTKQNKVDGIATYYFKVLKNTDSIYLDAKNIKITYYPENEITLSKDLSKIWLIHPFKSGKEYTISFSYQASPKKALYFTGDQIWTQGQGKYTSNWLPSIDDMNDKIEFDLSIIAPSNKTVIANGKLISFTRVGDRFKWKFNMQQPMASYLVAFVIGNFKMKKLASASGIPIQLYYQPEDSLKVEPTYRYTKQIFDFFEDEIGVPYPWQNYKQIPVRDFLYAGMENTTATIFSEAFVIDSTAFIDRNYVNVNAHELAHQWFGDLITEQSGKDHWLQEGFATYYALLAEKKLFGKYYYYWKLLQSAEKLKKLSDEGNGESLQNPKGSSLTFYEKGAWALHILKELIGEESFKLAIKNYLTKYKFKNVTTQNFIDEVKAVTMVDISSWEKDWIYQSAFKAEQAYQSLIKSPFVISYFKIEALRELPLEEKQQQLQDAILESNDYIAQEAVFQLYNESIKKTLPLYKLAFSSKNVLVRQALSISLTNIPFQLKTAYESLLQDPSYVTQEAALYNLWSNFPEDRFKYLDSLSKTKGFQDKNIRQLWLALAIITDDYKPEIKKVFKNELQSYSSSDFSFQVREKAFSYLFELHLWNDFTLINLLDACFHHNWRFKKSSRNLLKELIKDDRLKTSLLQIRKDLPKEVSDYINSLIK